MSIARHTSEEDDRLKKEYAEMKKEESWFPWIVGIVFILFLLGITYWSVFIWKIKI